MKAQLTETLPETPPRLTLWDIEAAWVELIHARAEAEELPAERPACLNCGGRGYHSSPAGSQHDTWPCATCDATGRSQSERELAITACDCAIQQYVAREVAKVDGIRGVVRTLKSAMEAAKAERDYQATRAASYEGMIARIKGFVQSAMEAAGKKRIDGRTGYLAIKGNGGVEPLITDDSLLPSEFRDVTIRLPENIWRQMCIAFGCPTSGEGIGVESFSVAPANARIRKALAEGGGIPGAHLEPRGSHVEIR